LGTYRLDNLILFISIFPDDMGLIGFYFTVISSGVTGVVCSPLDFIIQPTLWHDMVIQFRADTTIGPNFSFGLLIKRLLSSANNKSHPKPIQPWSHVQKVICAAEPVDPVVMDQVISVLGVKPDSLFIGYGLAELGLAACFAKYQVVNKLVASGDLDGQSKIRIVDDEKKINGEGVIGEIYINSPNLIASGYWGNAEETRLNFGNSLEGEEGEWLATGDIGLTIEGKLFVTGRSKEVIIINGRNYFPVDIERTIENQFPTVIRPGCVVAYQQSDSSIGIAAELRNGFRKEDCPGVFEIVRLVAEEHQAPVEYVCLLRDHTIPKTTSGKLKRIEVQKNSTIGNWTPKAIVNEWKKIKENTLQDEDVENSSDDDEDDIDSFLSALQFIPETSSGHTPKRRQSYLERNFAQFGVDDSVELSNHVGQALSSSFQSSTEQSVYYSAAFEKNFDSETAEQSAVNISLLLRNSSSASTVKPIKEKEIMHRLSLRASISKPGISKGTKKDASEKDGIPPTLGSLYGTQCPFAKGGMKEFYEQHGTKPYPHGNTIEVGIIQAESVEANLVHLERRLENGTAKREYELAEHIFSNSSFWTQVPGYSPHQFALSQDNKVHRDYYPWLISNFTNLPTLELLRSDVKQFISDKHEAFSIEDAKQFVLLTFFKLFAHQYLTESEMHDFKTFQGQVFDMVMRPHEEPSDGDILNHKAQYMTDFMERLKLNESQASALLDLLIFASMNLVTAIHVCIALLYCENDLFDSKSYAINEDTVLCFVWECLRLFPPQTSVCHVLKRLSHFVLLSHVLSSLNVHRWGGESTI
jgi:AMP-binding enzyme